MPDLPQDLRQQLRTAHGRRLEQLVDDYGARLGLPEVRQLLLNPFVTAEALELLANDRRLMAERRVRSAVAGHRRTPPQVALRFVSSLFWRELLEIVVDVRVSAAVRRSAEHYLVQRLPRLTVGEKVSLARRAVGRIARELSLDPTLRILKALLGNPRLVEQDLMPLLTSARSSPRALETVAASERWGHRYEVRRALCGNPQTPARNAVGLLPTLRREDLEPLANQEELGWLVRHRAKQILEEWPADAYRQRVQDIVLADDVRIELDATPRPGDAELRDAIDSAPS
ncbi:MAG: hypothetical protein MPN21_13230 [Thermoanaerobaculia bacterium]|nr:hypothetical protein [Thermoanaerobaculia bacterium]